MKTAALRSSRAGLIRARECLKYTGLVKITNPRALRNQVSTSDREALTLDTNLATESQQDSLETEEKQLLPYHNNNDTNNSESSQHAIVHRQQIAHLDQRLAELNQETLPLKGYSSSEKELPPQCDICGMAVTSSTELSQHYERVHPKPIQELESRQHASGEISGATTPAFGHGSVASIITSTSEEHAELEAVTKAPEIHRAMTPEPVRSSSIPQPKPPRALEIIELNDSFEEDELVSNGNLPLPQPPYTYPQISLYLKQSAHAIFRQSMEFAEDLRQATGKKAIDWDTFKLEIEVVRERFGVVDEWLARLFDVVDEMADDSDGGFGGKENAKVVLEQFVREFLDMTLGDKGKDGFWDWECEDELNEFKVRAEDCLGALRALDF
ncbi:hypothetical protein BJ508DRAFT_143948 [Ascobolus immersus RN42]|uniref:C2H2-type domain-containing protein n=1 Tax=Ascobolus immersus RN42 TaxID=1160509 RepID=A0A3N4I4V7_ASCIM|nr:hypothetical protein BJ508DRAFT_143948 [Ascobolus immersus RN42]